MDKPTAKSREWVFFRDESGRSAFNPKCNECAKECKQSFRATLVRCPVFVTRIDFPYTLLLSAKVIPKTD